jgi:hypothetical protein
MTKLEELRALREANTGRKVVRNKPDNRSTLDGPGNHKKPAPNGKPPVRAQTIEDIEKIIWAHLDIDCVSSPPIIEGVSEAAVAVSAVMAEMVARAVSGAVAPTGQPKKKGVVTTSPTECQVCAARRTAKTKAMRKYRSKVARKTKKR